MGFTSDLAVHLEKAVRARMAVLECLERRRAQLEGGDLGHVIDAFSEVVTTATNEELSSPRDTESIPEFLETVASEVESRAEGFKPGPTVATANGLAAEIRERITVEVTHVSDPFAEILSAVWEATVKIHQRCGAIGSNFPALEYRVEQSDGKPHDFPCALYVAGSLGFETVDGRDVSRVTLSVDPWQLDWPSIMAVPYVLFHECVAHALQGPWPGRSQPSASSPYAEGWMDLAAVLIHNAVMDGVAPADGLGDRFSHKAGHKRQAEVFSSARMMQTTKDRRRFAQRALGYGAGDRLVETFRRLPETGDDPIGAFLRVSLTLNTSDLPTRTKDAVASALYAELPFTWGGAQEGITVLELDAIATLRPRLGDALAGDFGPLVDWAEGVAIR